MESLNALIRVLEAGLGIGLVIFVHEAGHFIAARLCGVRVEVFSIGFGRKLFGWRRGTTQYQVAVVPFGGYVKMAGEDRYAEDADAPAPDSLIAKSVGQRFFIYSGGVLMNVLFGMVVFPILFAVGVPFTRPTLGEPAPGSPAWLADLQPGTQVLRVNGEEVFDYLHIPTAVAISGPEGVELEVLDPGATEPRTLVLQPERSDRPGLPSIGIAPNYDPDGHLRIVEGSPAERAGLQSGDSFLGVVDGVPGLSPVQQFMVATQAGQPVKVRVRGAEGERVVELAPDFRDSERLYLGITPRANRVVGVRPSPVLQRLGIAREDRLITVNGRPIRRSGDLQLALIATREPVSVVVRREGREVLLSGPALTREEALDAASDLALVADVDSTVILAEAGQPAAAAGIRDGDRVLRIDGKQVEDFVDITELVGSAARERRAVLLSLERAPAEPGGTPQLLDVEAAPAPRPVPEYGLDLELDHYVYRAGSPLTSIRVGLVCSWRMVEDSWLTMKRMLLGQVSSQYLGGIITIGAVSYSWLESGLAKLFYFLCMLSINLAFINVLPIPVLDGGHLFFLLVEKVKGSPVSERVLGYSQMVGLVLILSLMVYVTYNDIQRWFLPS